MRRAVTVADRFIALPRGWTILGLALAAWGILVLAVQLCSSLFAFVVASF